MTFKIWSRAAGNSTCEFRRVQPKVRDTAISISRIFDLPTHATMNPVKLINRFLWSSQSAQVKDEQDSDEMSKCLEVQAGKIHRASGSVNLLRKSVLILPLSDPRKGITTKSAHKAEDMAEQEGGETPTYTDWEGFGEEELVEGNTANATTPAGTPKKKKKKRKKKAKRESDSAAADTEVETSQMADSSSPKVKAILEVGESTINRHIGESSTPEESAVENLTAPKRSKTTNGTSPTRKPTLKSKAEVPAGDFAALMDEESPKFSALIKEAKPGKSVKQIKHRKSSQEALKPELAESKTAGNMNGDTIVQAMPKSRSSKLSTGSAKRKKSGTRRISDGVAEKAQAVNGDAGAISEPFSHTQHFDQDANAEVDAVMPAPSMRPKYDVDEEDEEFTVFDLSGQLQQDLRSIPHPSENGNEADEEPKRPSKKALGKRKAVEEPLLRKSSKKAKRGKEKGSLGQDLRTLGFVPPSDEGSHPRRGSTTSVQSLTLLTDIAEKVWEENNGISQEPELQSNSQTRVKYHKSSWNAINLPVERGDATETNPSLFVSDREPPKNLEAEGFAYNANALRRSLPVVEIRSMQSTPSLKSHRPAVKPTSKIPNTPKDKEFVAGAASTSKTLKTPKDKAIKASIPSTSKGKLSTHQFDALTAAVESYREFHDLTDFQLNDRIQADAKDKFAQQMWKEICEEVPNIPRRNVMNTCRRNYYNFKRGPWDNDEDDELKKAHKKHPGKWKLIGEIMNRFPEDVRDRWRNYLVCGDTMRKSNWELEEEKRLRRAVKQCIKEVQEQSRFTAGQILSEESFTDWGKVSELMGRTRSRLQCRDKWFQLKDREEADEDDLVAKMPISETWRMEAAALDARLFSADEKLALLRAIRDSGAAREGKIPWQTLKDELDGKGKRMAWKYCFRKLQECVTHRKIMDFKAVVTHLVDAFEEASPNEPAGFDLPIEIFPSSQNSAKMAKGRNRVTEDNRASTGSSTKTRTRGRKQSEDKHGEESSAPAAADPVSSARRRTFRDGMLKADDSQETTTSRARSVSADIAADVRQGFESIKRTPKSEGKYVIRKSKRNKFLSEEKVIEDPSDDENPVLNGVNGDEDEMDLDHEEGNNAAGESTVADEGDDEDPPEKSDDEQNFDLHRSAETSPDLDTSASEHAAEDDVDNEELPDQSDDEQEYDLRRSAERSPDLDTPVRGRSFKANLGSPIHLNGFHDDEGAVSSDDEDMSDIPAVRLSRMESVEL